MNFERYVILLSCIEGQDTTEAQIQAHVDFLKMLKVDGKLEACGPFTDYHGGMIILTADSMEEAKKIAESDPFVKEGCRTYEVRTWQLSCAENNHLGFG